MTKDEALKLALEALRQIDEAMPFPVAKLAQKAIKEALANVATNDTSQECVDKTNEIVHEAQRTWVGLTNEERAECWETIPELAMRKVEAKLKEKNT